MSILATFVSTMSAVKYSRNSPSRDIAPPSVYGTATRLNSQLDPRTLINVTWSFSVDPTFEYLVRFHFCDIVSVSPEQLFFNVYINSWLVALNLDLSNLTSKILGTPFYMDVVRTSSDSQVLSVSIGPSTLAPYPDGILNGLEIMKLSDSRGSFVARDFKANSNKKVWVIVGISIGVSFVAFFSALFLFVACRRRRSSLVVHSADDHIGNNRGGGSETQEISLPMELQFFSVQKLCTGSLL